MIANIKLESKKPFIVMPLEDYESIMETLDIISSNPNIKSELEKEKKEFLKGNYTIYNKEGNERKSKVTRRKKL